MNDGNDEPSTQLVRSGYRVPGRIYIQPQWIWDCINEMKLLRPDLYAPGQRPPPHLSPFVKPGARGAYDPRASLAEQEPEGEAEEAEAEEVSVASDSEEEPYSDAVKDDEIASEANGVLASSTTDPAARGEVPESHGMTIAASDDSDSDSSSTTSFAAFSEDDEAPDASSDKDDHNEDPTLHTLHQAELEAEATGLPFDPTENTNKPQLKSILKKSKSTTSSTTNDKPHKSVNDAIRTAAQRKRRAEAEELERRKMMLGNKKRKLVEKMLYSNTEKDREAEKLRGKRRKLEGKGLR